MTSIAKGFLFSVGAYLGNLIASLLCLAFLFAVGVGLLLLIVSGQF